MGLSLDAARRSYSVQCIQNAPEVHGPLELPQHMWKLACAHIIEEAQLKGSTRVRFTLESPDCQSQQAASNFWISRMGFDGTEPARRAAQDWENAKW